MNLLDMVILATMIFFIVRGIFRGFFREAGSLAGVIVGIWLAYTYESRLTDYLKGHVPEGAFLPFVSFALIFAVVFALCSVAGWGLRMLVKKMFLGWADRALGASLAIAKGIIIIYLVIVLITFFVPSRAPLIASSTLAPVIITSYQSMVNLISPGSYQRLKQKILGDGDGAHQILSGRLKDIQEKNGKE